MEEKFWNVSTGAHHKAQEDAVPGDSEKAFGAPAETNERRKGTPPEAKGAVVFHLYIHNGPRATASFTVSAE